MTDPTPQITPEQRAELVAELNDGIVEVPTPSCCRREYDHKATEKFMSDAADQLEADGVTIAAITAEHDAAQAEIARLTAALATAREGGMREAADMAYYLLTTMDEPTAHDRLGAAIDAFIGDNINASNDWLKKEMLSRITNAAAYDREKNKISLSEAQIIALLNCNTVGLPKNEAKVIKDLFEKLGTAYILTDG